MFLRNLAKSVLISTPIFIAYKYYSWRKKNKSKYIVQDDKYEEETHTRRISWLLQIQLEIDRKRILDANTIADNLDVINIKLHFKDFSDPYMYIYVIAI